MATITSPDTPVELNPIVAPDDRLGLDPGVGHSPVETNPVAPDGALYEVVDGVVVGTSSMGAYPVKLATTLGIHLGIHLLAHPSGQISIEGLFRIDARNQKRPDVAFISHERWPRGRRPPDGDPWEVIPDLAIEVISKSDLAWDVLAKVRHYLDAGVRAVWLVYPKEEVIHIYESFANIRVLTRADELDGGDVIPGFRLPLASLFEEEAEGEAAGPAA